MNVKKNDIIELTIEDMTHDGEGVGHFEGMTFFVKDAVIGDRIKALIMKLKKTYGYAKINEIITPSKDRVVPRCPVSKSCGGCQIQSMSYEAQLKYKENLVKNNIQRIGKLDSSQYQMLPIVGMEEPYFYRNKAQYPVGNGKDKEITIGYYAKHSHNIIETKKCFLGNEINEQILDIIKNYMKMYKVPAYVEETGKGTIRHVLIRCSKDLASFMVCIVSAKEKLPDVSSLIEALRKIPCIKSIMLNINTTRNNAILSSNTVCLWGDPFIEDSIGDIKFHISANSFYQVNPKMTEKLYQKALEFAGLTGKENVWDLYCGIGTISLFLAKQASHVRGVEIIPQAIEDAKANARLNGIENAEFFVGKAEEVVPEYYEKHPEENVDVIVVDPPRKGCDEILLSTIIKMNPLRVVYVSCDSATLARDLAFLSTQGYKLEKVQCFDQFGHTMHVETVVLMSRVKD